MIAKAGLSAGGIGPVPMYLYKTSDFLKGKKMVAINSINFVRIMAQIVYYFYYFSQSDWGFWGFYFDVGLAIKSNRIIKYSF